jgi:tripartite-type tricarboxylate transporter receptor subunit TctC
VKRSTFLKLLGALALGITAPAHAQSSWPTKPIKILVPFTPGGGTDILTRIIAARISEPLGQQVVVENRPGANTLIATEALVRAEPDGYTLLMQTNNFASNATLYAGKLNYDTYKDVVPVVLVAGNPHVLVVNPKLPAKNLAEFVALAKEKPGTISFASAGSGTVNHLAGELLKMLAGIDLLHVPYKGSGSVMPDLLSGQVNALFGATPNVTGYVKEGRLRALAVTTPKRFRNLPDVPSIAELGYADYDFSSWFGILAPAGTPRAIVDRINAEVNKALADPAVLQKLDNYVIYGGTPEQFGSFIKTQVERTAQIIKRSGAKIDN